MPLRSMLSLAVGLLFTIPLSQPAAAASGCVDCHRQRQASRDLGHDFRDWAASRHAREQVTCDLCHGGDGEAATQEAAHQGMRGSRDAASPVYYRNIPATCGQCHAAQREAFARSTHARRLAEAGSGPTCVTCHGSMGARTIPPEEARAVCRACHNPRMGLPHEVPDRAFDTLTVLARLRHDLAWVRRLVAVQRSCGQESGELVKQLAAVEKETEALTEAWHLFQLDRLRDRAARAEEDLLKVVGEGE